MTTHPVVFFLCADGGTVHERREATAIISALTPEFAPNVVRFETSADLQSTLALMAQLSRDQPLSVVSIVTGDIQPDASIKLPQRRGEEPVRCAVVKHISDYVSQERKNSIHPTTLLFVVNPMSNRVIPSRKNVSKELIDAIVAPNGAVEAAFLWMKGTGSHTLVLGGSESDCDDAEDRAGPGDIGVALAAEIATTMKAHPTNWDGFANRLKSREDQTHMTVKGSSLPVCIDVVGNGAGLQALFNHPRAETPPLTARASFQHNRTVEAPLAGEFPVPSSAILSTLNSMAPTSSHFVDPAAIATDPGPIAKPLPPPTPPSTIPFDVRAKPFVPSSAPLAPPHYDAQGFPGNPNHALLASRRGVNHCNICNCEVFGDTNWHLHLSSEKHRRKELLSNPAYAVASRDPTQTALLLNPANFFKCDVCNVVISGQANIDQHVGGQQHKRNALAKEFNDMLQVGQDAAFCPSCSETFANQEDYLAHMRSRHPPAAAW